MTKMPEHIINLRKYLFQESERNEDLVISYFRKIFGTDFERQSDAEGSDGYVPGHFVLEIKGKTGDWYSGLFQGLAYENKGLSFSIVIVVTKKFLGIWQKENIPNEILTAIREETGAPSAIGKKLARKFSSKKNNILNLALWRRPHLFEGLFEENLESWSDALKNFENTLRNNKKVRQKITLKNFVVKLREMKVFFETEQPIKTVRAFYSMIFGPWDEVSTVQLNNRYHDKATLGGSEITNLKPPMREKFKEFVENHSVVLSDNENIDSFFAKYDEALDSVDKEFRIRNGIFFTDLDLSKFAMWFVKQVVPNLGEDYLVIDPACGSGNLVTNWRSPLKLRHKVVSEIEPELLFAVEQRMKGDQWHNGKFTVVPKVRENKGLNFLDKSASEYLDILKISLEEKGLKPDKPIAFLCNPPYRSDDDQKASGVSYKIDEDIVKNIGKEASAERYLCFLAQMKLICEAAEESGLPSKSLLLIFTQTSWFTKREVSLPARKYILDAFKSRGAFFINGAEFFNVANKFPIAFSMWEYNDSESKLDADRPIKIIDLTHLKKSDLANLPWNNSDLLDSILGKLIKDSNTQLIGIERESFSGKWVGESRKNLYRATSKSEKKSKDYILGLPKGDERHHKKTAYGYAKGTEVGFLMDLTPCRTFDKEEEKNKIWFYLDKRFNKVNTARLLSGKPDSRGFCAKNEEVSKKLLIWYSISKCFGTCGFPLWANQLEMWIPDLSVTSKFKTLLNYSLAIAFSENECVEIVFPPNNPVKGATECHVSNQMTPLNKDSFWQKTLLPLVDKTNIDKKCLDLINKTNKLFKDWKDHLGGRVSIIASYKKNYFIDVGFLGLGAGLIQIKDYAQETDNKILLKTILEVQELTKKVKQELSNFLLNKSGLDYFGIKSVYSKIKNPSLDSNQKSKFDLTLEKRKTLAGLIINELENDSNLGLVKLAKIFYITDQHLQLNLDAHYIKDAAGPIDNRLFYNSKIGLFPNGESSDIGELRKTIFKKNGKILKFSKIGPSPSTKSLSKKSANIFQEKLEAIKQTITLFKPLNSDHAEVIATLYACWNDLLISKKEPTEKDIIRDFFKWNSGKKRFEEYKLLKALKWMKSKKLIPIGQGKKTSPKPNRKIPF